MSTLKNQFDVWLQLKNFSWSEMNLLVHNLINWTLCLVVDVGFVCKDVSVSHIFVINQMKQHNFPYLTVIDEIDWSFLFSALLSWELDVTFFSDHLVWCMSILPFFYQILQYFIHFFQGKAFFPYKNHWGFNDFRVTGITLC